ncbi:uncharacterized protein isoform X2 [Choristoneura fumiferana]|uniref:uncharacterized protein isoform X2 n=1 Tax=Choristoneura fumiferana TaxID=7141 RepID=UPI003D157751
MYFKLYFMLCMAASTYCLGTPAKLLAKLNDCPKTSGPSVLEYLDVDNSGVERLVVYFYKAKNSHQIIPFIPSREYQNCMKDLAEGAGELLYNYNENSIEGLFNIQEKTIRYKIKSTEIIPESSLDLEPQPWNKPHVPHKSHEYDNTGDTAAEDDEAVYSPEHDNSSPNNEAVIDDIDDYKKPDWHIPVEEPEGDNIPLQPSQSSSEHPDEKNPKEISVIGSHDGENPQDSDISFIKPIPIDENSRPSQYDEAPIMRPLENLIFHPNHKDQIKPIIGEEIGAPEITPQENPNIGPIHQEVLPIITGDINASPESPLENLIIRPYHKDLLHPIIEEETDASPIRLPEHPIIGLNHHDRLRPIIGDEIDISPERPLENPIVGPNHHGILRPIIEGEVVASPIRPLDNPNIGPKHQDVLQPIITHDIHVSPESPLENPTIRPYHKDLLHQIIEEEIDASPIRLPEHPNIGPKYQNVLRPIIRDDINASSESPLENPIIRPYHKDLLHPIIEEEIDASPIRHPENPIIGPDHHGLRPIIMDEIDTSPEKPRENHIIVPNHHDILRPIIEGEAVASPIRPLENPNIGPKHQDVLQTIITDDINASPESPLENPIIKPYHEDLLHPIIEEDMDVSPIRLPGHPIIGLNHHDRFRPIIGDEIDTSPERPLENSIIGPNRHDKLPSSGEKIEVNIDDTEHHTNPEKDTSHRDFVSKKINGGLDIDAENIKTLIIPKGDHGYSIIEHGDSKETLNSNENNALSHKTFLNVPSEEDAGNSDRLNLVYKWHKVKVPRIDSSGKVYGWFWKSVKSPVRSSSVKWSYWQSSGKNHRLTRWKHKSSSSKIYHRSSNDGISVANFDGWLKKEIRKMENNGNKMPSSDDDINTVKVAIEQTLKTNGIKLQSSGVLIDSKGNVLRLDNIQLRPIYIGRSLAYNRILQNTDTSLKYRIPANTPFLEGLLVSLIKPARTLGIVPLGITALPRLDSIEDVRKKILGSERTLHPFSIQSGLHKLIRGQLDKISPGLRSNVTVKEESKTEEKPEFRIIGGSFAVGSGTPLANRGRSGKD